jgi:hypothetical protein
MEGHARCRHSWEFKAVRRIEILAAIWSCARCLSTRVSKINVPTELTEATLKVSLGTFVGLLSEAQQFDQRFHELGQTRWLTGSAWSFDDGGAFFKSARVRPKGE